MTVTVKIYKKALDRMSPEVVAAGNGIIPTTHTLKAVLLSSDYTIDLENDEDYSDISASEVTGTGYTTGGKALTNVVKSTPTGKVMYDCDDVQWTTITVSARYMAIYDDTHTSNALISLIDFGEVKTASGGTFQDTISANGFMYWWNGEV